MTGAVNIVSLIQSFTAVEIAKRFNGSDTGTWTSGTLALPSTSSGPSVSAPYSAGAGPQGTGAAQTPGSVPQTGGKPAPGAPLNGAQTTAQITPGQSATSMPSATVTSGLAAAQLAAAPSGTTQAALVHATQNASLTSAQAGVPAGTMAGTMAFSVTHLAPPAQNLRPGQTDLASARTATLATHGAIGPAQAGASAGQTVTQPGIATSGAPLAPSAQANAAKIAPSMHAHAASQTANARGASGAGLPNVSASSSSAMQTASLNAAGSGAPPSRGTEMTSGVHSGPHSRAEHVAGTSAEGHQRTNQSSADRGASPARVPGETAPGLRTALQPNGLGAGRGSGTGATSVAGAEAGAALSSPLAGGSAAGAGAGTAASAALSAGLSSAGFAEVLGQALDAASFGRGGGGQVASGVIFNAAMMPGWPYPSAFAKDGPAAINDKAALHKLAGALEAMSPQEAAEYLAKIGANYAALRKLQALLRALDKVDEDSLKGMLASFLEVISTAVAALQTALEQMTEAEAAYAAVAYGEDEGHPRRHLKL